MIPRTREDLRIFQFLPDNEGVRRDRPNGKFGQPVDGEETENSVNKIERKIVWNLSTINHVHENRYE